MKNLTKNMKGASLTEAALYLGLVAAVSIPALYLLGEKVQFVFFQVQRAIY